MKSFACLMTTGSLRIFSPEQHYDQEKTLKTKSPSFQKRRGFCFKTDKSFTYKLQPVLMHCKHLQYRLLSKGLKMELRPAPVLPLFPHLHYGLL